MGKKRNSISNNGSFLPVYSDVAAVIGGNISISSTLSNTLLINEFAGAGVTLRSNGTNVAAFTPTTISLLNWSVSSAGHFTPSTDNTYNIGSSGVRLAGMYASGVIANDVRVLGQVRFNTSNGDIYQITSDGSDNARVRIGGGGDVANSRGAFISLYGNESTQFAATGGQLILDGGGISTGIIRLNSNGGTGADIQFAIASSVKLRFQNSSGGKLISNISNATEPGGTTGIFEIINAGQSTPTLRLTSTDLTSFSDSHIKLCAAQPAGTGFNFLTTITDAVNGSGTSSFAIRGDGAVLLAGDVIFYDSATGIIRRNTSDGADNLKTYICGGGGAGSTRGGQASFNGNEFATLPGCALIDSGNISGGSVYLRTWSSDGSIYFAPNGGVNRWSVNSSGQLVQDATNGGDIVLGLTGTMIRQNTTDGTDNKTIILTGGGGDPTSGGRGGWIRLQGNESNNGRVDIQAGNNGGDIYLNTWGSANINFCTGSSSPVRWSIDSSGNIISDLTNGGGLYFKNTGGIYWRNAASSAWYQTIYGDSSNNTNIASAGQIRLMAANSTDSALTVDTDGTLIHRTHTGYTGSATRRHTAVLNTTDATTTSIHTFTLADNTIYKYTVDLTGRLNSTTAKGVWGKLEFCVYRNNAGVATLSGTRLKIIDSHGSSGYDFDVDVSSNDVRIRITGAASETVSWIADIKWILVSTSA